jgi:galactose-1-phosphate uridylyltransferase
MEAYCVKCKTKRPMQNANKVVLKNKRHAMKGTCPVCGTNMTRFVKSSS